ncbi:hypothetical protein Taro_013823, partial [Colocasia esculenta]|nr:hypothetical protein [Colocasia esculenta]
NPCANPLTAALAGPRAVRARASTAPRLSAGPASPPTSSRRASRVGLASPASACSAPVHRPRRRTAEHPRPSGSTGSARIRPSRSMTWFPAGAALLCAGPPVWRATRVGRSKRDGLVFPAQRGVPLSPLLPSFTPFSVDPLSFSPSRPSSPFPVPHHANHRISTNMQRRLYGHSTDVEVRPLNEEKAVQAAADLFGEIFVFMVAGGVVIFEVQRSARSEARKEEMRKQELEAMKEKDEELAREVALIKARLAEIEKDARSRGLAGIFSFKHGDALEGSKPVTRAGNPTADPSEPVH